MSISSEASTHDRSSSINPSSGTSLLSDISPVPSPALRPKQSSHTNKADINITDLELGHIARYNTAPKTNKTAAVIPIAQSSSNSKASVSWIARLTSDVGRYIASGARQFGIRIKTYHRPLPFHTQIVNIFFRTWLHITLLLIPAGIALRFVPVPAAAIFAVNIAAMVPSIACLSYALDNIVMYLGDVIGGLLSTTFTNAATLITSVLILRTGDVGLAKTTLIGAVLSNTMLMPGLCFIAGGMSRKEQHFNADQVRIVGGQLLLAVFSIAQVTGYQIFAPGDYHVDSFSRSAAVIFPVVYILLLVFQLRAQAPNSPTTPLVRAASTLTHPELSLAMATTSLAIFTTLLTLNTSFATDQLSEIMKGNIPPEFLGLIMLPVLANDPTLVMIAIKNEQDLVLALTLGKSVQILLLILPVLLIISWSGAIDLGQASGKVFDLNFDGWEVMCLVSSVVAINYIISDGRSNWSYGVLIVAMFFYIATGAWFYTSTSLEPGS